MFIFGKGGAGPDVEPIKFVDVLGQVRCDASLKINDKWQLIVRRDDYRETCL